MYNNFSNYLNSYNNNPYNPVGNVAGINSPYQPQNQQEIPKVNGLAGANAFPLSANSSVLLLDINDPIVYLKQADGGGFCSVIPYDITLREQNKSPTINTDDLEKRIRRLEELYESNITTLNDIKQSKSSQPNKQH